MAVVRSRGADRAVTQTAFGWSEERSIFQSCASTYGSLVAVCAKRLCAGVLGLG